MVAAALCAALGLIGCEPEVELEVCGSLTVISRADIENAQNCGEINGDLSLLGGTAEITASDFPNLTKISGDLVVTNFANREPRIQRLTLGKLQSVGRRLQISSIASLVSASFPALTSVGAPGGAGGTLDVSFAALRRLDLPALTTINGSVSMRSMNEFCSANLRRVTRVTGRVDLESLPSIPFSALSNLRASAQGGASVIDVGCCFASDSFGCTPDGAGSCSSGACL
jgi:hypothetical protein